jgi:hypothetical protein
MMAYLAEGAPAATPASQDEATRRSRIKTRGKAKGTERENVSRSHRLIIEATVRL